MAQPFPPLEKVQITARLPVRSQSVGASSLLLLKTHQSSTQAVSLGHEGQSTGQGVDRTLTHAGATAQPAQPALRSQGLGYAVRALLLDSSPLCASLWEVTPLE